MKTIVSLLVVSCCLFMNVSEVHLEVSGINLTKKGNLNIGIFKKEHFLNPGMASYKKIVPVSKSKMEIDFSDLEPGTYAIAVIQDQDKNGKLSTNFAGIPNEPYGFSKNQFGLFGPPGFEQVSFTIKKGEKTTLKIVLK